MKTSILTKNKMPFCPGCGHGVSVNHISKALIELNYNPLDVIIVSDIGCSGLVDPLFKTHTVHGLHGRSPALGLGVAMGLANTRKKVIVIQGDGGATIGLQHILEAARRNIDITLLVFNNLLYGMTGGQISGLSTDRFKELRGFETDTPPFDIVKLAHEAGAVSSSRVISPKQFTAHIKSAIEAPGFSLLELASICPSYGLKKLNELDDFSEEAINFQNKREIKETIYADKESLLSKLPIIENGYQHHIEDQIGFVLAGSAGGGIQSAAKLLAQVGILSGLHATMKGEYPVTVGTGFSVAEVILSKKPIHFTGLESADVLIAVTDDGLQKIKNKINAKTISILDSSLEIDSNTNIDKQTFIKNAGKKGAAINALSYWIQKTDYLDSNALFKAIESHKYAEILQKAIYKPKVTA